MGGGGLGRGAVGLAGGSGDWMPVRSGGRAAPLQGRCAFACDQDGHTEFARRVHAGGKGPVGDGRVWGEMGQRAGENGPWLDVMAAMVAARIRNVADGGLLPRRNRSGHRFPGTVPVQCFREPRNWARMPPNPAFSWKKSPLCLL